MATDWLALADDRGCVDVKDQNKQTHLIMLIKSYNESDIPDHYHLSLILRSIYSN